MKLIIGNVTTKAIVGGSDNLLDFDILKELNNYLKVRPNGYQHSPKYKEGKWDGWRRFITKSNVFATGFLPLVVPFLEENGVIIEVTDERGKLPELNDTLDDWIGNIEGSEWRGRDYQMEDISKVTNYIKIAGEDYYFPRGIMDCATNAGKNSYSALIINNLKNKEDDVVFMVSNRTIYKQAVEFFSQVIEEPVGEVCSGKYKPKRVTVCMVKTLLNRAKESLNVRKWLNEVSVLIVDESDEAGASEYSKVLGYIGAGMRVFVSGTPLEAGKVNNMIAVGLSGKVLAKRTNKFLVDEGYSQKPIINIILNDNAYKPLVRYTDELKANVHLSRNRAEIIAGLINKHSDKQILITFIERVHGYFMYDVAKELNPNVDIGIVHGTSASREGIIEDFKTGRISVLFASMILKRGANIPNIECLIAAQAGKSIITVKQVLGRALRHDGKNDEVPVYDFYDEGKYVADHSRGRIRMYKNEDFEVTLNYKARRGKPIK